jgi:hypothetical protein
VQSIEQRKYASEQLILQLHGPTVTSVRTPGWLVAGGWC